MKTIVGLDVCKNAVVACSISSRPSEPRQLYYNSVFPKFPATAAGIKGILALQPDVAVIEPTGGNYSKLWVTKLAAAGVKVVLVGHRELRRYRENLDLPDKDDQADALALACYYAEHQDNPRRFVRSRDPDIAKLRDLVLQLHHLNRVQSPIINRTRQQLAWQFPEVASIGLNASLFWGWLAGLRQSKRYDDLYAKTVGLGISIDVRHNAQLLHEIVLREARIEREMRNLLRLAKFLSYRKVFAAFGFGERVEALILSQIYPLENYLASDGKPEVIIRKGKNSGKPTRRYLSLKRFQKALGVAPTRESSGDKSKTSCRAGSSLCRAGLWQWIFTRIEPTKARVTSPIGQRLGDYLDFQKSVCPVKLARGRTSALAAKLLFEELVKQLVD